MNEEAYDAGYAHGFEVAYGANYHGGPLGVDGIYGIFWAEGYRAGFEAGRYARIEAEHEAKVG